MKIRFLLLLLLSGATSVLYAQEITYEQLEKIAIIDQKVMMPMRDGIRLATDKIGRAHV